MRRYLFLTLTLLATQNDSAEAGVKMKVERGKDGPSVTVTARKIGWRLGRRQTKIKMTLGGKVTPKIGQTVVKGESEALPSREVKVEVTSQEGGVNTSLSANARMGVFGAHYQSDSQGPAGERRFVARVERGPLQVRSSVGKNEVEDVLGQFKKTYSDGSFHEVDIQQKYYLEDTNPIVRERDGWSGVIVNMFQQSGKLAVTDTTFGVRAEAGHEIAGPQTLRVIHQGFLRTTTANLGGNNDGVTKTWNWKKSAE